MDWDKLGQTVRAIEGETKPSGMSQYEVSLRRRREPILDYMSERFGMTTDKYDEEEILESFENHMRKFNAGQSVTTVGEFNYLNAGNENQLEQKRRTANRAYEAWDETKGAFSSGDIGDIADAVTDYGRALIVDPVNVFSLGAGKLIASGSARAASQAVRATAAKSARRTLEKAVKSGVKNLSTAKQKREYATQLYQSKLRELIKSEPMQQARSRAVKQESIAIGAFEGLSSGLIDSAYQGAQIAAGRQEDYSLASTALAGTLGLSGGVLGFGLESLRGTAKPIFASQRLEEARHARQVELEALSKKPADPEKIKKGVKGLRKGMRSWMSRVRSGEELVNLGADEVEDITLKNFILGNPEMGFKGVSDILIDAGKIAPSGTKRQSGWLLNQISALPKDLKTEVRELWDETVRPFLKKDQTLEDYLDVVAEGTRQSGQVLNVFSQSAKAHNRARLAGSRNPETSVIEDEVENLRTKKELFGKLGEVQDLYIRSLVTNPATTALNVIGWTKATATQSLSDISRSLLYATEGTYRALRGDMTNAKELSIKAGKLSRSQLQKFRNMLDPFTTEEEMVDYLMLRPEARKEMFRYLSGGIETQNVYREFSESTDALFKELEELDIGIQAPSKAGPVEKYLTAFQTAYGVQMVDHVTKSVEFRNALDRRMIDEFGMSYREFMEDDSMVRLMVKENDEENFKRFLRVEAGAVQDALENTYSRPFKDKKTLVGNLAGAIEKIRDVPVVGTLVPFGQFFNNTVAFMSNHSGISLAAKPFIGSTRTNQDLIAKTAAGWSLAGLATYNASKEIEEGLAWNETRLSDGTIQDDTYNFPTSLFRWAGHVLARWQDGEGIPEELLNDFGRVFGTQAAFRGLEDAGEVLGSILEEIQNAERVDQAVAGGLKETLKTATSLYASGFTRHLDPANKALATLRGGDYEPVDRSQVNETLNKSIRYVDQFYEIMMNQIGAESTLRPAVSATTRRERTASFSSIFGFREAQPRSNIELVMAEVDRPNWINESYLRDPEAEATLKEVMLPILESYSIKLMNSFEFRDANMGLKEKLVQRMFTSARTDAKNMLLAEVTGKDYKTGLIVEITNQDQKKAKEYAERMFDVSLEELHSLNEVDLELLLDLIKGEDKAYRDTAKGIFE